MSEPGDNTNSFVYFHGDVVNVLLPGKITIDEHS